MTAPLSFIADVDTVRLRVTIRTAIASCIALGLGTLVGLDHPQWAAMTVWIVALPTRGQRLERSLARIGGTIIGALAGVALIIITGGNPAGIIGGLTLWIGLCAGTGNLLTGFRSYISLLAGYSAAMVALLGVGHEGTIWSLAGDRVFTICLGGVNGALASILFAPQPAHVDLAQEARQITETCLDHIARGGSDHKEAAELISAMARLDERLDMLSAGTFNIRRQAREIRRLMAGLTELILDTGIRPPSHGDAGVSLDCRSLPASDNATLTRITALAETLTAQSPQTADRLLALLVPLRLLAASGPLVTARTRQPSPPAHYDWLGAGRAALRSAATVVATGLIWLLTDWSLGPYMVMGATIMTSVFSTFPNPGLQMRWVLGGSVAGAYAAMVAHLFIIPMMPGILPAALLTMPLILLGAPVMAHRRIGLAGMEYNLIYLLMMNPNLPMNADFPHTLLQALAVVLGPVCAYLAFLAVPIDPRRRLSFIIRLMIRDLATTVRKNTGNSKHRERWRLRSHHRLMALARLAERSGYRSSLAAGGGMAALALEEAVSGIRALPASQKGDRRAERAARAVSLSLAYLPRRPERVARTLQAAGERLNGTYPRQAEQLSNTAALVWANQDFFRLAN